MPFVKSGETSHLRVEPRRSAGALTSADPETRWNAARAIGIDADAVPQLAAALRAEPVPRVREAIITALMRIGDEASIAALMACLRSPDAGLRTACLDALRAMPQAILPFLASALEDHDSDVRIMATELARSVPPADANRLLCKLLEGERHANVCAVAIDVLAEVGTSDAIPALQKCAERFRTTAFLPFAASIAIARISGTEG